MTKRKEQQPTLYTLPLLPLRDMVLFPHIVVPLVVGRPRSIAALEEAERGNGTLVLAAQKDPAQDEPSLEEIHPVGTVGKVIQLLRLADGTANVLVEGKARVTIERFLDAEGLFFVEGRDLSRPEPLTVELEALSRTVRDFFGTYYKESKKVGPTMNYSVQALEDPCHLADTLAAHLPLKLEDRQELLAMPETMDRLERIHFLMQREVEVLRTSRLIRARVKKQLGRVQGKEERPTREGAAPPAAGREPDPQDEMVAEMDKTDVPGTFVIAGDGPHEPPIGRIGAKSVCIGFVEDIHPFLKAGSVFLYSSLMDSQPTVLMEALSAGLPVVVRKVYGTGSHEFVEDGVTGVVYTDAEEGPRRAAEIALDGDVRAAMASAAKNAVSTKYTWEQSARGYHEVFSRLIRRRSS